MSSNDHFWLGIVNVFNCNTGMPLGGEVSSHDVGLESGAGAGEAKLAAVELMISVAPYPVPAFVIWDMLAPFYGG